MLMIGYTIDLVILHQRPWDDGVEHHVDPCCCELGHADASAEYSYLV